MRVRCDGSEIGKMQRGSFQGEAKLADMASETRDRGQLKATLMLQRRPARCRCRCRRRCSGPRPCGVWIADGLSRRIIVTRLSLLHDSGHMLQIRYRSAPTEHQESKTTLPYSVNL
jgi:hypothetical protein